MKVKIEKILPQDLEAVEKMILKIHESRGYPVPEELQPILSYTLAKMIAGGMYVIFVATVNKHNKRKVIGMGSVLFKVTTAGPIGYGEDIYVDEKYRGTDVADRLIKAGEMETKLRGCKNMVVELKPELQPMFERKGYHILDIMMIKEV